MEKKLIVAVFSSLTLTGCATSAAGLYRTDVHSEYTSEKSAQIVASCVSTELMGNNPVLQIAEGHWAVLRNNGFNVPIIRWDIYDLEEGGSRIEFRKSVSIASGEDKAARLCF